MPFKPFPDTSSQSHSITERTWGVPHYRQCQVYNRPTTHGLPIRLTLPNKSSGELEVPFPFRYFRENRPPPPFSNGHLKDQANIRLTGGGKWSDEKCPGITNHVSPCLLYRNTHRLREGGINQVTHNLRKALQTKSSRP